MTRFITLATALSALLAATLPALADGTMGGKVIDCYCTDRSGARVELGEMICLQVDGRMFTAQCQMSLNVPMWREVQDGCLSSRSVVVPDQDLQPAVDTGLVDAHI